MPIKQDEFKSIIQLIRDSKTVSEEDFKSHFENIKTKLSSLSKEDLNSFIPSKIKKDAYFT